MLDATGSASFLALTGLATFAFSSAIRGSSSCYVISLFVNSILNASEFLQPTENIKVFWGF
jgi:hypothetical protein